MNEISIKNMFEAALATASALIKNNEIENNSANEIKIKIKLILIKIKRKRGRLKKRAILVTI